MEGGELSMRKKLWLYLIGGIVIIAGAYYGYTYFKKDTQPLAAVQATTKVIKGDIEVRISGTGSIQASNKESITASVQGTVDKVLVKVGDQVKKGDTLVTLEAEDVSDKISSEKLNLEKKLIELEQLQLKIKEAGRDDASTNEEMDLQLKMKNLEINTSHESIASLQEDAGAETIVSSIDGQITAVNVKEGDTLGGNGGTSSSTIEIADYSKLEIVVAIDELDIPKVKLGQKAEVIADALPDEVIEGVVSEIANEGTASNGVATFDVTIAFTTKLAALKSGMSAEAGVMVEQKKDILMLPIETVTTMGKRSFVNVPQTATTTATAAANANGSGGGSTQGSAGANPQGGTSVNPQGDTGTNSQGGTGVNSQGGTGVNPQGAAGGNTGSNRTGQRAGNMRSIKVVTTGIHNEDYIEIVSGLEEGDLVVVPTVVATGTSAAIPGAGGAGFGLGGAGGFPAGGGGGFQGGGAGGGGGTRATGGGGGTERQ